MFTGDLTPLGDGSWLLSIFLLSIRLAVVFVLAPPLSAIAMPARARVLLVVALAAAFSLGMPGAATSVPLEIGAVMQASASEVLLGLMLALGIMLAFAAFTFAGRLLDVQIGFGMAQVLDPTTNRPVPVLTAAFQQFSVLLFLLMNGHHAVLRGLALSLERFPLGLPWNWHGAVWPILRQVSGLFSLGFALAAPIAFCILLVELTMGVLSRALPQLNVFVFGLPVKIVVGLAALSFWFLGIGGVANRVYASIFGAWEQVFLAQALVPGGGR